MEDQYEQNFTKQWFGTPDLNSYHSQPDNPNGKFNGFTPTDESMMFDGLLGEADLNQSWFDPAKSPIPGDTAVADLNFNASFTSPSDQSSFLPGVTQQGPFANTYNTIAPLQQPFAPLQCNLINEPAYVSPQFRQSTDFESNSIYQLQPFPVSDQNSYLFGFNQGNHLPQQLAPNPPNPDLGFFPYSDTAFNTDQQQNTGKAGKLYFYDDDVRVVGGFSDPDYLESSAFNIDLAAVRAYYSNTSSPSTLMGDLDMSGRSTSEPSSISGSSFWTDGVAQMRHQMAAEGTVPMMMTMTMENARTLSEYQEVEPNIHGREARMDKGKQLGTLGEFGKSQGPTFRTGSMHPWVTLPRLTNLANLNRSHISTSHHSTHTRPIHALNGTIFDRCKEMGQTESSPSLETLKHNIRIADRSALLDPSRNNGWTSVNGDGDNRPPPPEPTQTDTQADGRKRKRSLQTGSSNGVQAERSRSEANTEAHPATNARESAVQSAQHGLGISVPRKARTASASSENSVITPSQKPLRPAAEVESTHAPGNSANLPVAGNGRVEMKNGRSHGKTDDVESGSDVDTDALGFLQRVAAAESDDEEEVAAAIKPRPIRPTGNIVPHVWRPPQQPVGTHYTIYSPLVQHPAYTQPRPPPESFDPSAPLSAHEEAQLRDEGRFTKMEQSFLKDAIDEYCKKHNISVELANDYVCGKAREGNIPGNFWDEVCRALPQRTKNSIQRAAKRVFRNNQKKGSWTTEEERALAAAYHKAPDQWAKICEEVPGRSAEQCRDRWRNYTSNGVQLTRGPWSEEEETQFIEICKAMLHQARRDRDEQRRQGRTLSTEFDPIDHLNFTAISSMMQGKRSRLHCRNKWHKLKKRPDVEAVIESIVKGRPIDTSAAPQPNGSLAPKASAPHVTVPQTANTSATVLPSAPQQVVQHTAERHQLPPVSQALASLLPPAAHPSISRAAAGPSCAHLFPTTTKPSTSSSFQTSRPPAATTFNAGQSINSTAAGAQDSRTSSASAPLHPVLMHRPSLPPPTPSAPAVARTSVLPAILAPVSEPLTHPSTSAAPKISSTPPSWVNTPPEVPQLFHSSTSLPAGLLTTHHRATPGPKRGISITATGPASAGAPLLYNGTQLSSATVTASLERTSYAGSPSQHARGPVLAPITAISPPRNEVSQPISNADTTTREVPFTLPSVAAPSTAAEGRNAQAPTVLIEAARFNGYGSSARTTASPDPSTSLHANDDNIDNRPVRKKQKTAKARDEE